MKCLSALTLCVAMAALPVMRPLAGEGVPRAKLRAAVDAAVASRRYALPAGTCDGALRTDVSINAENSASLVVTQIKYDRALGQAMFLLRPNNDPAVPPFYVRCTFRAASLPATQIAHAPVPPPNAPEEKSLGAVLVNVRRTARLYLVSENSRAVVTVRVLQSGHRGERVRVRLPLHGKTLAARVVGLDALEASF